MYEIHRKIWHEKRMISSKTLFGYSLILFQKTDRFHEGKTVRFKWMNLSITLIIYRVHIELRVYRPTNGSISQPKLNISKEVAIHKISVLFRDVY